MSAILACTEAPPVTAARLTTGSAPGSAAKTRSPRAHSNAAAAQSKSAVIRQEARQEKYQKLRMRPPRNCPKFAPSGLYSKAKCVVAGAAAEALLAEGRSQFLLLDNLVYVRLQ